MLGCRNYGAAVLHSWLRKTPIFGVVFTTKSSVFVLLLEATASCTWNTVKRLDVKESKLLLGLCIRSSRFLRIGNLPPNT